MAESRAAYLKRARAWLSANGHKVGEKGKIRRDLLQLFDAHVAQERGARKAGAERSITTPTGTNKKGWTCGFCTPSHGQHRGCKDVGHRCPERVRAGTATGQEYTWCRCALNGHPETWPLRWPGVDTAPAVA